MDDNYFVSASRDQNFALWNIKDIHEIQCDDDDDSELVLSVKKYFVTQLQVVVYNHIKCYSTNNYKHFLHFQWINMSVFGILSTLNQ